jgi:hypothetical protein
VLLGNIGLGWFLGGIFLLSAATYVLAFYIKTILKWFRLLGTNLLEIWRSLLRSLKRNYPSWFEKSKNRHRKQDSEDLSPQSAMGQSLAGRQSARDILEDRSSPQDPTKAMEEGVRDDISIGTGPVRDQIE